MKYILQFDTGSINQQNYTAEKIINRLEHLTKHLDVSRVIFGWYDDAYQNQKICQYLHARNIEAYFWLPVFAEIIDLKEEDEYIESSLFVTGASKLSLGDNFEFVCQSSQRNIKFIEDKFLQLTKNVDIDGVFLDRIRYKSPSLSKDGIFGCQCEKCRKLYPENVVSGDVYDKLVPFAIKDGVYAFEDEKLDSLMKIKRTVITEQIEKLFAFFKERNLKVGLDTFAICIADFVGQDILALDKYSDFIKPMLYLKTTAPAGLPYELAGLSDKCVDALNKLWGTDLMSIDGSIAQCKYLLDRNVYITPGVDVNNIEGICHSDDDYVIEYLKKLKEINTLETVLCWNSMMITDSLLEKIQKL